jgi:hypothetical protein
VLFLSWFRLVLSVPRPIQITSQCFLTGLRYFSASSSLVLGVFGLLDLRNLSHFMLKTLLLNRLRHETIWCEKDGLQFSTLDSVKWTL